jgi:hypothetical protein
MYHHGLSLVKSASCQKRTVVCCECPSSLFLMLEFETVVDICFAEFYD